MSRRRGEFEHRTSIFEGAFRAWSHLGGLAPEDVESRPAAELDPLTNPIENDPRLSTGGNRARNPDGTPRREYPYEPLPRSGLAHPYVQAILSPWLGPDADNEAIQLGLTTLRTWWQHRRKGESGSAIAALGTEKMKGVVEGYTRHFFTLAHCLIANDKEQPPRTLHGRMKELDKLRSKSTKKRARGGNEDKGPLVGPTGLVSSLSDNMSAQINADLTDSNLSPLERLHVAQRRQLAESSFQSLDLGASGGGLSSIINMKGKCVPGKMDLPGVVDAVTRNATQLAHRGVGPAAVSSSGFMSSKDQYGDLYTTPVVFVSGTGDIMIAMKIDGITCAHCVKIVETVLKGCNGNKSPIEGLLDATADQALCSVLIKIDQVSSAKRVAFEAARNLAMVGYTAIAKDMSIAGQSGAKNSATNLSALNAAFAAVGASDGKHIFDWTSLCSCPDTGVLQQDCSRHSQMNSSIFDAFDARKQQVAEYLLNSGGMQYGVGSDGNEHRQDVSTAQPALDSGVPVNQSIQPDIFEGPLRVDQRLDFFGIEPPTGGGLEAPMILHAMAPPPVQAPLPPINPANNDSQKAQRNPSVISYGNGLRHMSLTSETTFGRAMSGLSALSIDWENLEDFDVEVDHSAHITNSPSKLPTDHHGPRRPSIRRSFLAHNVAAAAAAVATAMSGESPDGSHVSFKE